MSRSGSEYEMSVQMPYGSGQPRAPSSSAGSGGNGGSYRAGSSRPGSSRAGSSYAGPSHPGPSYPAPSYTGPSYAGPSYAGPSYTGPSYAGSSNVAPPGSISSNAVSVGSSGPGPNRATRDYKRFVRPTNWKTITEAGVDTSTGELADLFTPEFLGIRCNRLFIELLQHQNPKQRGNHAILKIDFVSEQGEFKGLKVDMGLDFSKQPINVRGRTYTGGTLWVHPVAYLGASHSSVWTIEVPVMDGATTAELLSPIFGHRLQHFYFLQNDGFYGCRDFVTQALYCMCQANVAQSNIIRRSIGDSVRASGVSGQRPQYTSAYRALGTRIDDADRVTASPIDKGHFLEYSRVITRAMPYPQQSAGGRRRQEDEGCCCCCM